MLHSAFRLVWGLLAFLLVILAAPPHRPVHAVSVDTGTTDRPGRDQEAAAIPPSSILDAPKDTDPVYIGNRGTAGPAPAPAPHFEPDPNPSASISSDRIGTTAAEFRIDESGSATYSIPVRAAAGTAGVAPEITLNYSSSGGPGIAGLGWSIGGLSAISRCRQTLGQDMNASAISWGSSAEFCLDGQRLILVNGTHGLNGAAYREEIDTGTLVTIAGTTSGGPDYFTVQRKDGSMAYYGKSPDNADPNAKLNNSAGQTLTWAIRQFKDSVGNPIWFDYENTGGAQRIVDIKYAYGSNRTHPAGHGARIHFSYETRTDPEAGYVAGYLFANDRRLSSIATYTRTSGEENLLQYHLAYDEGHNVTTDTTSRLTSIQECYSWICLPKTTFDWRLPALPGVYRTSTGFTMANNGSALAAHRPTDIDGDGKTDLVWLELDGSTPKLNYAISIGTDFVQRSFDGISATEIAVGSVNAGQKIKLETFDFNADGRSDVAVYDYPAGYWRIFLSKPQGDGSWKLSAGSLTDATADGNLGNRRATFADINSDGLVDVVTIDSAIDAQFSVRYLEKDPGQPVESNRFYRFGAAEPFVASQFWDGDYTLPGFSLELDSANADFNGDGRVDLMLVGEVTERDPPCQPVCPRNGASEKIRAAMVVTSDNSFARYFGLDSVVAENRIYPVDLNSDDLTDLVYAKGSNSFYYAINKGDGTLAAEVLLEDPTLGRNPVNGEPGPDDPMFTDWNLDGYPDLVWKVTDDSTTDLQARIRIRYWNPETGAFDPAALSPLMPLARRSRNESALFLDMNGDGAPDMTRFNMDEQGEVQVVQQVHGDQSLPNQEINRIERFTNGLGASTYITYEPMSGSNHYERLDVDSAPGMGEFCDAEPGTITCIPIPITVAEPDSFYAALNSDWDLPEGTQTLGKYAPVLEVNGPMLIVTRVESDAPAAGAAPGDASATSRNAIEYFYLESKIQASGRGMLGFERLKTIDMQTGVQTTTAYRQDWPFVGYPRKSEVRSAAGHLLSYSTSDWQSFEYNADSAAIAKTQGTAALGPIHPLLVQTVEMAYDLVNDGADQGAMLSATIATNSYDAEANPDISTVTHKNAEGTTVKSVVTDNNYFDDPPSLPLREARLSDTTVTTIRSGESADLVRRSAFTYYNENHDYRRGLLKTETIEPDNPIFTLTTTHDYDEFGNRDYSAATGGTQTRCAVITKNFDARGRYIKETFDCLGRKVGEVVTRDRFGSPTRTRTFLDTSGSYTETDIFYGYLGREFMRRHSNGSFTKSYLTRLANELEVCPAGTVYKAIVSNGGGSEGQACIDRLGRSVRKLKTGFDGQWIAQDTEYDLPGRIAFASDPYFLPGNPQHWTSRTFDTLGRIRTTVLPDNSVHSVSYTGLGSTATNDLGHRRTEHRNVLGEITEVVDNLGGHTRYRYDHVGNLRRTTDNAHNEVVFSYDLLGRKVASDDPDQGLWTYGYNHFGELISQTDANGNQSIMSYDQLGRMRWRLEKCRDSTTGLCPQNTRNPIESLTYWFYDSAPYGLGQLTSVVELISDYAQNTSYDEFGRVSQVTTVFGPDLYREKTTYDQFGRVFQSFDAGGDGSFQNSGIQNTYNAHGYLESIADAVLLTNGEPAATYRTITSMNARSQVTAETLGNGVQTNRLYTAETGRIEEINSYANGVDAQQLKYEWDSVGNLKFRYEESSNKNLQEQFWYDGLNRLRQHQVSGEQQITITYDPDHIGNIASKTGVGTYGYGAGSAGPHAVTSAGNDIYTYDANGNNVSGADRTIRYTSFNKPYEIKLDKKAGGHTTRFSYGPGRKRYKRTDLTSENELTETFYIGNVEIIDRPNGTRETKRQIGGFVIETSIYDTNGTFTNRQTRYLHKDHLGSLDVITDSQGHVVAELSFDPWGQRRNAINWEALGDIQLVNFDHGMTTRGFTGHEMLDEVNIIHMNGRIYDPGLGRFLQADPVIQEVYNPQNLNRYSYVLNNPLNATDPTGFFLSRLFKVLNKLLGPIAPYLGLILLAIPGVGAWAAQSWQNAFRFGFWTGGVSSGSARGALTGGVSGAAFHGIGQKFSETAGLFKEGGLGHIGSHGAVGGITSVLQGGRFGNGFLSAGMTKAANINKLMPGSSSGLDASRTIAASVVGGTISGLTGGKFANGAVTAGFAQAFNANRAEKKRVNTLERQKRHNAFGIIARHLPDWWAEEVSGPFGEVSDVIAGSIRENLQFGTTLKAVFGAGAGTSSIFTIDGIANGNTVITIDYAKGAMIEGGFFIRGHILSSGEISGFYQSASVCMGGCIRAAWDYQGNYNVGTRLVFPVAVGGGIAGGYATSGRHVLGNITEDQGLHR